MTSQSAVGSSYPRREALDKALGLAKYTDDLHFSNLAYGMILRSPHSHAKVTKLDPSAALAIPGVLGVLTPKDVPDKLYNCSGNPPSPLIIPDERVLTDHPLCFGDRICAVVAQSMELCEKALRALEIEYEILPALMSIEDALKPGAPILQPGINRDANVMFRHLFTQGDVEEGFAQADHIFKGTFTTQPIAHVSMEPTGCVCLWERNGKITVWSPSQTLYQERRIMAEIFDKNESDIRFIKPAMGGGFGARQQLQNQHVGALLSKIAGRPVKLINTREEDMYAAATRHECKCTIKMGVRADGTITTTSIQSYLNGGPYITHSPTVSAAAGRKLQYRAQHYRYEGISVYTNSPTAGAMRGYGNIQVVVGREILLERIARELGLDPVGFRLKNHVGVGDEFPAAGYSIDSCGIEDCVVQAEEIRAQIDREYPLRREGNLRDAWGYAFSCHSSGPSNKDGMSSAVVMANDDGTITLSIGSADIGQGSETTMSQIAAQALGINYSEMSVLAADTAVNPYDTGTFASGQTFVCGNAVNLACADLIDKLRKALANYYGVSPEAVTEEQGVYRVEAGEAIHRHTFREAVRLVAFGMKGRVLIGSGTYKATASPPPFAVCYARVTYDQAENTIQVTDVIQIADVGTPINPEAVRGQIEGGISMGVGYALYEDIQYNKRANKTPTTGLLDYKVPLSVDMPRIHSGIARNVYDPNGPMGAKSIGELSSIPIAPAIVNAVESITGRSFDALPLSRHFMTKGLRMDHGFPQGGERQ